MQMRSTLPDALKEVPESKRTEIRLRLKLATPMIGGGVESGQPDEDWPIRASEIRGQLRWWWRAVYGYSLEPAEMQRQEALLFGWAGKAWESRDGEAQAIESAISIVIEGVQNASYGRECKSSLRPPGPGSDGGCNFAGCLNATGECKQIPGYVKDVLLQRSESTSISVCRQCEFDLSLVPKISRLTKQLMESLITAIQAWLLLGGIGARWRRGAGSLQLIQTNLSEPSLDKLQIANAEIRTQVPTVAGAKLFVGSCTESAMDAWHRAIDQWRALRKGADPGHERDQGLSYEEIRAANSWPDWETSLKPETDASGQFFISVPRARLGLPFTLYRPDDEKRISYVLRTSTRCASFVIARPLWIGGAWCPCWLLLVSPQFNDGDLTWEQGSTTASISTKYAEMPYSPVDEPDDEDWTDIRDILRYYALTSGWKEVW